MIKKQHKINLTHIATSYPEAVDLTDSQYKSLSFVHSFKTGIYLSQALQDEVLGMIVSNVLGDDWEEQFFFDSIV